MDQPLASIYLGILHHYGFHMPTNHIRASRYYDLALRQLSSGAAVGVAAADAAQLKTILSALRYSLRWEQQQYTAWLPVQWVTRQVLQQWW